jgi:hypothetical protein
MVCQVFASDWSSPKFLIDPVEELLVVHHRTVEVGLSCRRPDIEHVGPTRPRIARDRVDAPRVEQLRIRMDEREVPQASFDTIQKIRPSEAPLAGTAERRESR